MSLTIPNRHHSGLSKLLTLPGELIDTVIASLEEADLTIHPEILMRNVVAKETGLGSEDVEAVSDAIVSLFVLHGETNLALDKLVDDLLEAFESNIGNTNLTGEKLELVRKWLTRLLSIENLLLSAKALHIKFEQENVFSSAKVVTEILPVFSANVEDEPKGALLVHQLGVHYFHSGRHRTTYFRLDLDEIDELINVLERAKKKAASLQSFLVSTNIKYIQNV